MAELNRLREQAARAWQEGAWRRAEKLLRQALRLRPGEPELHRQLGLVLHRQDDNDRAADAIRRALDRAPDHAMAHMNLGSIEAARGDLAVALVHLRKACALAPDVAAAWFNLGKTLKLDAREEEAKQVLERAVHLDPAHAGARTVLGDVLKACGEIEAAEAALRDALALAPGSAHAWWSLANLKVSSLSLADLALLASEIGRRSDAEPRSRAMLLFALARGYDQHAQYEAAFETFCEANAVMRRILPWSRTDFSAEAAAVSEAFSAPPAAAPTDSRPAPIFIVGLPRSGSTLLEQILAAHPDVTGASELPDLPAVIAAESRRREQAFAVWASQSTAADWARLAEDYRRRTARWVEYGPPQRVTDKLPNNFLYVGAALAMFPTAHVIASDRDPMDTCWSCFQQYFAAGQAFSYALDDLVAYYADFRRLDRVWDRLFPERYRRVRYEDLVSDPAGVIPGILGFLGLSQHAACLAPHRTNRSVRTASAAQVREPIDQRGKGRWRPYADRLEPWRQALECSVPD